MADTDEEEDLLKSSDSEDDTIVKENGDEVCDIKEELQEFKKDDTNGNRSYIDYQELIKNFGCDKIDCQIFFDEIETDMPQVINLFMSFCMIFPHVILG